QRYPNPAFGGQRGAFGWSFARGVKPDSIRILFKTCRNAGSPTQGVHDPGLGRDARISPYFKRFLWVADRADGAFSRLSSRFGRPPSRITCFRRSEINWN